MPTVPATQEDEVAKKKWQVGGRTNLQLPLRQTEQLVETHTVNFYSKNYCRNILGKLKEFTDPLKEAALQTPQNSQKSVSFQSRREKKNICL